MTSLGPSRTRRVEPVRQYRTFTRFRSAGARGRSGPIGVVFSGQTCCSEVQVAYATGKKLGGAVVRNRLRRRLRAIMSEKVATLPDGAYLVTAGTGATRFSFEELKVAVGQALRVATRQVVPEPAREHGKR
ncbi:MAG: ribonuclease P protein component [Acidimicrobiales bacterium]